MAVVEVLTTGKTRDTGGHGGRVVTLSPPTSEAGVQFPASSGKAGSCLPLVSSLQYRTLTNCMYWFPLPFPHDMTCTVLKAT